MTQKSGAEGPGETKSTPSNVPGPRPPKTGAEAQPAGAQRGARVSGQERKQYLIASRRAPGFTPFAVSPLALGSVEQALRANPEIEVVDTLGPKAGFGTLAADGMSGAPHVIVAKMDQTKAQTLHQQGQGQLIVEEDQPLSLLDAPFSAPISGGSVASAPALTVQVVVIGPDESPVEAAEVYLYGSLLPAVGVTNSMGEVTLSLLGGTQQSLRGLYVKPKADFWSFYQSQPALGTAQPNVVVLRPLSETFPNFPNQQVVGWGQKAMRMDQLPADRRGQGIKIAIVDSGAANSHEDLRSISRGVDVLAKRNNPSNWMVDTIAHGTHCAGVIAGHSENKVGILGFAPAAEIHACKIFPGGQISQLVDALEYCIEKQIDVVNLSLGTDQVSEVLEQQLLRLTSLGIACVVAAGNSGGPVQYPASSPNVLAVAAIGRLGEFPPDSYHAQTVQAPAADGFFSPRFTCFGPEIAVCAPGVAVVSSVPPNNFAAWDGTSMAAPHVTGLAALVLAHHPDFAGPFRARNALRVQRLFQIIKASARPVNIGDPRRTGFGIPDAPTALSLQLGTQPSTHPGAQLGTQPAPQAAQAAFAPQGFFGNLLPQSAPPLGGMLGSLAGHPMLGPQIGAAVGEVGRYSPFAAAPQWIPSQLLPLIYSSAPPWTLMVGSQDGYRGWWNW